MTYQQTVDWMFNQLPMFQRQGKVAFKAKLDNTIAFAAFLGNPEKKFKSVHVAGTNGKGSTSHMLASVLQEAGYKVGLYTSPHLKDFRERIKINGKEVSRQFVIQFVKKNKRFFDEHQLSFFEMTVGMAFDYFAKQRVDIAIVEVGLGGRLDSTNIIVPEVSIITNIGLDHIDILGDTLAKIALEKAGIIKPGVPVVVSEYQKEIFPVFKDVANINNSEIHLAEEVSVDYRSDLLGDYQLKNIKGVVVALKLLKGFKITEGQIKNGLLSVVKNTGLKGRWQQLNEAPRVVCDTGHNKEGISLVLHQIKKEKFNQLRIVLGVVKDKDLNGVLPLFPKNAVYYFCSPNMPRGLEANELQEKASEYGLIGDVYVSVNEAYKAALNDANTNDFIYIGGSTFVVAEVV